jgi:hypothetical protein
MDVGMRLKACKNKDFVLILQAYRLELMLAYRFKNILSRRWQRKTQTRPSILKRLTSIGTNPCNYNANSKRNAVSCTECRKLKASVTYILDKRLVLLAQNLP